MEFLSIDEIEDEVFETSFHSIDPGEDKISIFRLKEMNGENKPEPLLIEDKARFVLFPIKQPEVNIIN
jgi:hypothetical protein